MCNEKTVEYTIHLDGEKKKKFKIQKYIRPKLRDKEKVQLFDKLQDIIEEEYYKQVHYENDLVLFNRENPNKKSSESFFWRIIENQRFSDKLNMLRKIVRLKDEADSIIFHKEYIEETEAELKRRRNVKAENLKIQKRNKNKPDDEKEPLLWLLKKQQSEDSIKQLLIRHVADYIQEKSSRVGDGKIWCYKRGDLADKCIDVFNDYCTGRAVGDDSAPFKNYEKFRKAVMDRLIKNGYHSEEYKKKRKRS